LVYAVWTDIGKPGGDGATPYMFFASVFLAILPQMRVRRPWRRAAVVLGIWTVGMIVAAIVAVVSGGYGGVSQSGAATVPSRNPIPPVATPTPPVDTPTPVGPSVHVCTKAHYSATQVVCTRDDGTLHRSQLAAAQLCYTNGDNTFQYTGMHYQLWRVQAGGADESLGSPAELNNSSLMNSEECIDFKWVVDSSGAPLESGTTYQVEVDNVAAAGVTSGGGSGAATPLGTTQFTYKD